MATASGRATTGADSERPLGLTPRGTGTSLRTDDVGAGLRGRTPAPCILCAVRGPFGLSPRAAAGLRLPGRRASRIYRGWRRSGRISVTSVVMAQVQ